MKISNNISPYFKSNYNFVITSKNGENAANALNKIYKKEGSKLQVFEKYAKSAKEVEKGIYEQISVCACERYDKYIENILKSHKINYLKSSQKEALDIDFIYSRMNVDEDSYFNKVKACVLDVSKIEKLFKKKEDLYISYNGGRNSISNRYQNFIDYLKTGQKIEAPRIEITEALNEPDIEFIDGRHRFSVLRDMGMTQMPFALSEQSYEIAKKYDLLA